MLILCFDTETTGLKFNTSYIIQFSWIVYDTKKKKIQTSNNHIIKLADYSTMTPENTRIHGITRDQSDEFGVSIKPLLHRFIQDMHTVDMTIAHNMYFDKNMILHECNRNGIEDPFKEYEPTKLYCTMERGKWLCKIPLFYNVEENGIMVRKQRTYKTGTFQYKRPKLIELHEHLFPLTKINTTLLHNAYIDILVTLSCFCRMYLRMDIKQHLLEIEPKLFL